MKNFNKLNWLREGSTLGQTGKESVKSNAMWRNVATLLVVLMVGFGQMWG